MKCICFVSLASIGLFSQVDRIRANDLRVLDASLAHKDPKADVLWYDIRGLRIEGRGWDDTASFYDRLPRQAEGVVRPPVWTLSRHSAGICTRFITDAREIQARWTLTSSRLAMPHMPATGVSGLDLYVRTERGWRWLATGFPRAATNSVRLVGGLPEGRREYLLYLPLYNGVKQVEIGVAGQSIVAQAPQYPESHRKPIVFWGTSITQGGCASRPGMVHTAILGRRLKRPVINLGFSGNGRLEPEVAQLIAQLDAAVFVLDCLPNLNGQQVTQRIEPVIKILRAAHPQTPILLVEDRTYSDSFLVTSRRVRNQGNRQALRRAFDKMTSQGVTGLHYLKGEGLLGTDGEDTVDGSHPTDLGFLRQAAAFQSALTPLLDAKPGGGPKTTR